MKFTLTVTFFCYLILACNQSEKIESPEEQVLISENNVEIETEDSVYLENFDREVTQELWLSENYYPNLRFSSDMDSVWFQFDGQCEYCFQVFQPFNTINVFFDTIENCTHNIGLKDQYTDIESPKIGDSFIKIHRNADTLFATYLFPEWTERINLKNTNYPCFVDKFIRKNAP